MESTVFAGSSFLELLGAVASSALTVGSKQEGSRDTFVAFSFRTSSSILPGPGTLSFSTRPTFSIVVVAMFSGFAILP